MIVHPITINNMPLRDYFAGQALGGFAAFADQHWDIHAAAKRAYEYADAMLEARTL